ncbi:MAG: protein-L-isoaspartate O-methyltransferase [Bordetella sp.]|jgi:protein-L-isoaspartate(D-aspartate) O-methyltransferase
MQTLDVEQARANMIVQQIRPWDVLDDGVLKCLQRLPREQFVPEYLQHLAFVDMELPIGEGQVMLAPKVEARMLQELSLKANDEALEIGSGSGYLAGLLSLQCRTVTSVEKYPSLVELAQSNLQAAQRQNVTVLEGNGLLEDPRWAHRQFDVIVVSGGLPEIPKVFLKLLRPRGRLIALIGKAPIMQAVLVEETRFSKRQFGLFETLTQDLEDIPLRDRFEF